MRLKRFLIGALVAGSLLGSAVGVSAAQTQPGIPGTPNCHGQFISFFSTTGSTNPGQFSKLTMPHESVQDLQIGVRETLCAAP